MTEPTKVKFKKLQNGKTYLSSGYYQNEQDFRNRNCTLFFVEMTNKTKPIPKKKDVEDEK